MRRIVIPALLTLLSCPASASAGLTLTLNVPPGSTILPGQVVEGDLAISGVTNLTYYTIALSLSGTGGAAGTDYSFTSWQRASDADYVFGSEGSFDGTTSQPPDNSFQLLTFSDIGVADPGVTLGPSDVKQIAHFSFRTLIPISLTLTFDTQILELVGPGDQPIPEFESIADEAGSYTVELFAVVPEPSSISLLVIGMFAWSLRRRKTACI